MLEIKFALLQSLGTFYCFTYIYVQEIHQYPWCVMVVVVQKRFASLAISDIVGCGLRSLSKIDSLCFPFLKTLENGWLICILFAINDDDSHFNSISSQILSFVGSLWRTSISCFIYLYFVVHVFFRGVFKSLIVLISLQAPLEFFIWFILLFWFV